MGTEGITWLSQGAEVLAAMTAHDDGAAHCDVLIVGSGYGGAVVAQAMAGSRREDGEPARIWVLERGLEHVPGRFPSRFAELAKFVRFSMQDGRPPRGNAEGLFDLRIGADMSVLVGNGLGGGSLINSNVMETPDKSVFDSGWPAEHAKGKLAAAYERALDGLAVMKVPAGKETAKLRTLDDLLAAGGKPAAERCRVTVNFGDAEERPIPGVRIPPCTLCGDCLTGCNVGAKRSLDTTYLARARAAGAELFCGGFVERIEPSPAGGSWIVHWHLTESSRRAADGKAFRLHATNVVLAAGTLGSTEILMRSERSGLRFSRELGHHFSGNGDSIVGAKGHKNPVHAVDHEESEPSRDGRSVGPTITGMARIKSATAPTFVAEEFAVPAALRAMFGEVTTSLEAIASEALAKPADSVVTDRDIEHTSLYGLICDDGATGRLTLERPGSPRSRALESGVRIVWDKWGIGAFNPITLTSMAFRELTAGLNFVPPQDGFFTHLPVSTHPLGGCRMADRVEDGVVDAWGRVFDAGRQNPVHRGLAVLDGSILPKALGINPALTIAALAEHAVPTLMRDWHLKAEAAAKPVALGMRPIVRRPAAAPASSTWRLRERQSGTLTAGPYSGKFAVLDIDLGEVAGFREWLAKPPRRLRIETALLELRSGPERDAVVESTATLRGYVELFGPVSKETENQAGFELVYRLEVIDPPEVHVASFLPKGAEVRGLKRILQGVDGRHSVWRDLTELDIFIAGESAGRLGLDLGDLADRGEALLRLTDASSLPAALGDLAGIALYFVRRLLPTLLGGYQAAQGLLGTYRPAEELPSKRRPATVLGQPPADRELGNGAFLSRYAIPGGVRKTSDCPVLLIHGLAMSGNSFTHSSLPSSLAASLLSAGREVWVLDLRSSIANEAGRRDPASAKWTVERVAEDIPLAVQQITGGKGQVDVFAHCFGGVMFCLAALKGTGMTGRIRSAVLSQVGPLLRLSPMNRLRGFLSAYVWRQGLIEELDCCPAGNTLVDQLIEAVCSTFPYHDDNDPQYTQDPRPQDLIRHRADAIFGQMFEATNLSAATYERLDELLGWVKTPLLAQTIEFARQELLTYASGRNVVLHRTNFAKNFAFPVLIIHGRENRVFDWRGSRLSLELLHELRGLGKPEKPKRNGKVTFFGEGTSAQLAVIDGYGHLDSVIGERASTDIFPLVEKFLGTTMPGLDRPNLREQVQIEVPWVGPMLAPVWKNADGSVTLRLLVRAALRRAKAAGVAVVPLHVVDGKPEPRYDLARRLPWPKGSRARLKLRVDLTHLQEQGLDTFALVTLHRDLPLDVMRRIARRSIDSLNYFALDLDRIPEDPPGAEAETTGPRWLAKSTPLGTESTMALQAWFESEEGAAWPDACFTVAAKAVAAAALPATGRFERPLTFALGSCQYPSGPLDAGPATASYARMLADAGDPDGPQFLLLTGDQVYVDATAGLFDPSATPSMDGAITTHDLDRLYERTWRLPAVRSTMARIPVVTMIDDHEIRNDYPGLSGKRQPTANDRNTRRAVAAAARYCVHLTNGRPLGGADSLSYRWYPAGVPFFMLETRLLRERRTPSSVGEARILGEEVMNSLIDGLGKLPRSLPKFIVTSTPILPPERFRAGRTAFPERLRSDSWSGYPQSTSRLMRTILTERIPGVVLLSGDSHNCSVSEFTFEADPSLKVISIVSSGLYAPWPFANQRADEVILDGTVSLGSDGPPGTMKSALFSTSPGYVVVSVAPAGGGTPATLEVSLKSTDGKTSRHAFAL